MKEVEESFRAAGVNARLEVLIGEGQYATVGAAVDGANAIDVWRALRLLLPPKGFWPVVLGKAFEVEGLRVNWEGSPSDEIEMAASFEPESWLQERFDEDTNYYERAHGPWPGDVSPLEGFTIPRELMSDRPLREVYIGAVPTPHSWEVPAYLGFGGWNDCPSACEHVAMLKYWFSRYGAEVVGVSNDTIECAVSRPPTSRDEALTLAFEQFVYCGDIVIQGVGTVENLAASLLGGQIWYFWWD
jgi:hypothetical protein